jgi:hypothetical protein
VIALALVASSALSFGAATAIGTFDSTDIADPHLQAIEPKLLGEPAVVASGTSADVGRWEVLKAVSDRGVCLSLNLPDVSARARRSAPAGVTVGELDFGQVCGVDETFAVASVGGTGSRAGDFDLAFGRATAGDSVDIELPGRVHRTVSLAGASGIAPSGAGRALGEARYFVAPLPPSRDVARASLTDRDGTVLAQRDVP